MYQISGYVIDAATSEPIEGASVVERGGSGTETQGDGSFSLSVLDDVSVVDISCVGYATRTFSASEVPENVALEESASLMNSYVVTAIRKKPYIALIIVIIIILIVVNFKTIKLWLSFPPKLQQ